MGNYLYRYLISADLKKAKIESSIPELILPERKISCSYFSLQEVLDWLDYFATEPVVSFDIEVMQYELASIAFSSSPEIACSIPLDERWRVEEEALIYRAIQRVLGNPNSIKVGQNLIFDIHFLQSRCGIMTNGPVYDTMLAHSIMYPDLRKGLGFLGSIYLGAQPYWKDMVKFHNIKNES
jgi:DNA polymerase I-like protein with 3'-5' exonuclease and polymerase domains